MPLEWNATRSERMHVHVESTREVFSLNQKTAKKVTMSCEGNRDTLKVVCMLQPRDAQSITSQMLKRELENVRRELRERQDWSA